MVVTFAVDAAAAAALLRADCPTENNGRHARDAGVGEACIR